MSLRSAIFCLSLYLMPYISSAQGAVDSLAFVMCRSQKIVRTIRVSPGGEGCQTIYTKMGVDKVVGGGKKPVTCVEVMKNIQTNLEGAAWKCREVSSSAISEFGN